MYNEIFSLQTILLVLSNFFLKCHLLAVKFDLNDCLL